jgi:hypothetical protein
MPRRRADRLFDILRILRVLTDANPGCHHGPQWGRNPRSPPLNRWPLSARSCPPLPSGLRSVIHPMRTFGCG